MNNKIVKALIFTVGAAIGSAVTWKIIKTKYEQMAIEEINAIREYYFNEIAKRSKDAVDTLDTLKHQVSTLGYASEQNDKPITEKKEGKQMTVNEPRVITPDEFGELDDYECVSLNYYADGVLTNDWDEPIEDIDEIVGKDSLERFGEYEQDSVFVRNDQQKIDYEILRDSRNYADLYSENTESSEDE